MAGMLDIEVKKDSKFREVQLTDEVINKSKPPMMPVR